VGCALISLVIPVHNEAGVIARVVQDACAVLPRLADDFEIVLVDDGSADGTAAVAAAAMGEASFRLQVVRHEVRQGYGITVADGLHAARGDIVAFVDGDGQFDLEDLVRLAEGLNKADMVAGYRAGRADPAYRGGISAAFNLAVRLLYGLHVRDVDCGMKVLRRPLLDAISPLQARSALLNTEIYFKARACEARVEQVPVTHLPRRTGRRSGARLRPILRACRELPLLRWRLARSWEPPQA